MGNTRVDGKTFAGPSETVFIKTFIKDPIELLKQVVGSVYSRYKKYAAKEGETTTKRGIEYWMGIRYHTTILETVRTDKKGMKYLEVMTTVDGMLWNSTRREKRELS